MTRKNLNYFYFEEPKEEYKTELNLTKKKVSTSPISRNGGLRACLKIKSEND